MVSFSFLVSKKSYSSLLLKTYLSILLQNLDFPHTAHQIDEKIIRQLIRDSEGEGCIQEEPSEWIPAVMDDSILEEALGRIPLTTEAFKAKVDNPPIFEAEERGEIGMPS